MLLDRGSPAEAEPLFRRALEGREQLLGARHPATIATVHGFSRLMREHGEADAADALLARFSQSVSVA